MLDFEKLPRFKNEASRIVALIPEWANAYEVPSQVIIRQLGFAHGWIGSNPKRAPKHDVVRFLNNWMRKAHEFGNLTVDKPQKAAALPQEPEPDMTFEEMVAIRRRNFPQRGTIAYEHKDAIDVEVSGGK